MTKFLRFFFIFMFSLTVVACDTDDGKAEEMGESVDEAIEDTGEGLEDAGEEIKEKSEEACENVTDDENC